MIKETEVLDSEKVPDGYQRTVVGIIPKDWKVARLETLYPEIRNGFVGTATPFYVEKGVKYLQGKNIKKGRIIAEGLVNISEKFHHKQRKSVLRVNDIVMVQSGHVGECAVITPEYENSNCHALIVMSPTVGVESRYYSYLFNSNYGERLIYKIRTGNTVEHILASDMKELIVPVPSLSEQKGISRIIESWDRAVALTQELIEQRKILRKGLAQTVLTGKVRLTDGMKFESTAITRRLDEIRRGESPEGYHRHKWLTIPDDWKVVKIGDIADQVSLPNVDNNEYPVLSCTKYEGLVDSLTYFGRRVFSEDLSKYKIVGKGHLAYATNHIEEGSIGIQTLYDHALISPMYTVFSANDRMIDPSFLYLLLKTETYRRVFETMMSASVDRRGSLRWREFAKIPIPLPPIEEQRSILKVLNSADEQITLLDKQLAQLLQQRNGLMQLLITGKLRVQG